MKLICSTIFYIMMWLRGIASFILMLFAGISLLGGVVFAFNQGLFSFMPLLYFGMSFACFMLREFYDQILLKLNPTGNDLILYK